MFQKKTPLQKEWDSMRKQEIRFLKNKAKQKESILNRQLADKVPDKLQMTLDTAFEKAFSLIFEKGTGIIDKTYPKEKVRENYQINEFADSLKQSRKTVHSFVKTAQGSGTRNLVLSGAAGIGMGLVGVGIPDIPLLTAMMLKSVYEIAVSYGYEYDTETEKGFILMLIQGAVSCGKTMTQIDEQINAFIMEEKLPNDFELNVQIRQTANLLSKELLYMKFLQGIPVVGAVGGAYDVIYMKHIIEYANIKYLRRFLMNKKQIFQK